MLVRLVVFLWCLLFDFVEHGLSFGSLFDGRLSPDAAGDGAAV